MKEKQAIQYIKGLGMWYRKPKTYFRSYAHQIEVLKKIDNVDSVRLTRGVLDFKLNDIIYKYNIKSKYKFKIPWIKFRLNFKKNRLGTLPESEACYVHHAINHSGKKDKYAYGSCLRDLSDYLYPKDIISPLIFTNALTSYVSVNENNDKRMKSHVEEMGKYITRCLI